MNRPQLREVVLFRDLSGEALTELRKLLRPIVYQAGELIFQEGGPSAGLYIILNGLVQYGKLSGRRNRRRILKILGPGDTFGEEALFSSEVCACPGFARALTDASLACVEKGAFLNFMERHPMVAQRLCEWLTRQIKVFECKLVELAYESLEQNLLRLLFVLTERFGVRGKDGIHLKLELSRQDLAELLGAHLDTVIHTLSKLRERGLIAFREQKLIIKDLARLRELAEPQTTCLEEKLF